MTILAVIPLKLTHPGRDLEPRSRPARPDQRHVARTQRAGTGPGELRAGRRNHRSLERQESLQLLAAGDRNPGRHRPGLDAAATVLASTCGNDTPFTVTSNGLPGVQGDFSSFTAAVQQVQDARIYAGFHYRFSTEDGATLGAQVATTSPTH